MPGRRCAIYGCTNCKMVTKISAPNIIYHNFPNENSLLDSKTTLIEWVNCCRRSDKFNTRTSAVCSIHFAENAYERDLQNELLGLPLRRKLKKTAVPTLYLPGKEQNSDTSLTRQERNTRTNIIKKIKKELVDSPALDSETTANPKESKNHIIFASHYKNHITLYLPGKEQNSDTSEKNTRTNLIKKIKKELVDSSALDSETTANPKESKNHIIFKKEPK